MDNEQPHYWFAAKHYGWGWGPARTWQGWVVYAAFVAAVAAVAAMFPPRYAPAAFGASVVVLVALLALVCWLKGEPPHWRWGGK